MICAELEQMESQLDEIIIKLEDPDLTTRERNELEAAYARLSGVITAHQKAGHDGSPCYEE